MFEKLKERYKYAKETLNFIRFKQNYIVLPSLLLFVAIDLIVAFVLFCLGKANNVFVIVSLSLILVAIIAYIVLEVVVRKKEVALEAEKLKIFFEAEIIERPTLEYVLPRVGEAGVVYLVFCKDKFMIENTEYNYKDFDCGLYTSNYKRQINLIVVFKRKEDNLEEENEEQENKVKEFSLPLNLNLLSILNNFKIEISNPDVLKFIKENQTSAAKQILKYGKIQNNYYETK